MSHRATILYIPHGGGPMPLLDDPGHAAMSRFLRAYPATIERPDAILVISAHWEAPRVTVTAAARPPLIFDYYGFPAETYEYEYSAPGAPDLAARVREMLTQAGIDAELDAERGFDHGLFVPLLLMYPMADIPCIQVSLVEGLDPGLHLRIGKALTALKSENLLILGSGLSFHNMQALMRKNDDSVDPRNHAFEDWLTSICTDPVTDEHARESALINWESAPQARYCHPREEHLLPLQVCYGVGQAAARSVFRDEVMGFLSSAYQWR